MKVIPSQTVIGLVAAGMIALGGPLALAADNTNADWPCVQHKVAMLTSAQMWDGPDVDDLAQWRDNEEIKKLIAVLASRRVPIEDALERAIASPQWRTPDLGGPLGTKAFGERLAALVGEVAAAR